MEEEKKDTKETKEVKEVKEKKVEQKIKSLNDYTPEELEQKLKELKMKLVANIKLSPEEKLLEHEYNEQINAQQQYFAELENQRQAESLVEEQEKLRNEFKAAPEEEKLSGDVKGVYLKKGSSPINEFFAKRQMNKVGKKARTKGGTIIEKVYADSSIELIWTKQPKKFVEFISTNERGEKIRTITRISKTKHRLKGTPVPIQVILEGVSENISLHEGADMSLSAQHVNQMNMLYYESGYLDALEAKEQKKDKFDFNKLVPILIFIAIAIGLVCVFMISQLNTNVEAIKAMATAARIVAPEIPVV